MTFQNISQLISAVCLLLTANTALAQTKDFSSWLDAFRAEASAQGISEATLDKALSNISIDENVITLDRKQPEKTKSFEQYIKTVLNSTRVERAIEEYTFNREILEETGRHYGVQPEYIVALWGIESNFGDRMGSNSVVEALATLAYDGRRSEYFRGELLKSLRIIDDGHISAENMVGSWAGAMGQCQFMPSSFYSYAVDANNDGKKDIWNDTQDVFASVANYLSSVGWDGSAELGSKVSHLDTRTYKKYKNKKVNISQWKKLGIVPDNELAAHANYKLMSGNHDERGPYYLVGVNYDNVLKWNRSRYFALAVGSLADSISKGVSNR